MHGNHNLPSLFLIPWKWKTACIHTHTHTRMHAHAHLSPTLYPMSRFCRICSSDSYNGTCRALFYRCFMKKWNRKGGRKGRKERKKESREGMRRKERKCFLNSLGSSSLNRIFLKFLYCRTSQSIYWEWQNNFSWKINFFFLPFAGPVPRGQWSLSVLPALGPVGCRVEQEEAWNPSLFLPLIR